LSPVIGRAIDESADPLLEQFAPLLPRPFQGRAIDRADFNQIVVVALEQGFAVLQQLDDVPVELLLPGVFRQPLQ
jgi:hypothetical protein